MRREWDDGHIIMPAPEHYDEDKWMERLESQGVRFVPQGPNMPKNALIKILQDIYGRPPVSH